jgi:maltose-binding protein MalE
VSEVQLLSFEEVSVENNDNYYIYPPSIEAVPIYYLKNEGRTYRGIKINDTYEEVVDLYGEPHKSVYNNGVLDWIKYYTIGIPDSSTGSELTFYFKNGLVDDVKVIGPS